jgi:hypothetical protein
VSTLRSVTPAEVAHEATAVDLLIEDRRRRRDAVLHRLELARTLRRRQRRYA